VNSIEPRPQKAQVAGSRRDFSFLPATYGPTIAEILGLADNGRRLMPLAAGPCLSERARKSLRSLDAAGLFERRELVSAGFAEAARCGLFLYFSCLDECHEIAQKIASPTGSYWHGMMHRQEPDFANAAYWLRRVNQHEIFPALREAAGEPDWDPFRFIDSCEKVYRSPQAALRMRLEEIQLIEWQLLFDFSCRRAVEPET